MNTNNYGITLVEILIAITILGILSAICAPNMIKAVERSNYLVKEGNSRLLCSIIQTYNNEQLSESHKIRDIVIKSRSDINNEAILFKIPDDFDWNMLYPIQIDSSGKVSIQYDD